jgi:hypothetical protein
MLAADTLNNTIWKVYDAIELVNLNLNSLGAFEGQGEDLAGSVWGLTDTVRHIRAVGLGFRVATVMIAPIPVLLSQHCL